MVRAEEGTSVMRLFARRGVLRAAPAFAVGADQAVKNSVANATTATYMGSGTPAILPQNATAIRAFKKAQNAFFKSQDYRVRLRTSSHSSAGGHGEDVNINALRSIAAQHKAHMHVAAAIQRAKEEQSFTAMLIDKFGVADWWRERNGVDSF